MPNSPCFTPFAQPVSTISLPEQFTYPFFYEPHPLTIAASEQLQQQLETLPHLKAENAGKMFGVLVVKNEQNELGFLAAYSGQVDADKASIDFVPPISSMQLNDENYLAKSKIINDINAQINELEHSEQLKSISQLLATANEGFEKELQAQHALMQKSRKKRKKQRSDAEKKSSKTKIQQLKKKLATQSIEEKKQLQALKQKWQTQLVTLEQAHSKIDDELEHLKKRRKTLSKSLQKMLFAQYQFLNIEGETEDLNAIFAKLPEHTPASGAGDCAAPKLLQHAFKHKLTPIAMGEFWWGAPPKSSVRQHKNYYPSCFSKCQPILGHMLKGLNVEPSPLLNNPAQDKELAVVYQDDDLVIVNKPAEFLSVPGITIDDSVFLRMKTQFPEATGPLIVHRLDMSTSGLLIIALNKRAHKAIQKQFIERTIEKRYVALVDGNIEQESGTIELPLTPDFDDKPRQKVCYQKGKPSLTTWQVLERKNNTTRLQLYPKTGRTHQLRVHCAHVLGLNTPIVGDTHYGKKADRLHLHAEYLAFTHPITHERLEFKVAADF
ncbi:RluA family pseudouridine synthase [Pseudoalteromonas sp. H71]|uniref:RluA family pseudouridine synthase n=1 Tax=Pseudoalteromonas sp. H71 TaxID=1348395 RepID=UPI000731419D|nr:RluA family pseudouridine synthase [Pseudoalteromonas sp. H71]KTD99162.1 RNA pseudouridine synthase [Pseudoalteromonas sp. H71]